jgi:hypothetical protein
VGGKPTQMTVDDRCSLSGFSQALVSVILSHLPSATNNRISQLFD